MAANEVQAYLEYIRTIGVEAWIPCSPGYGPKMSVSDQCRCGVLCLDYKGSEIYIRSNSRRAMNFVNFVPGSTHPGKNHGHHDLQNMPVEFAVADYDTKMRYRFVGDNRGENHVNGNAPLKRFVGVRCGNGSIYCNCYNNNYFPILSHHDDRDGLAGNSGSKKSIKIDKTYFIPKLGVQYKRIVNDKLTKEVRVAKSYVSSLPAVMENHQHHRHLYRPQHYHFNHHHDHYNHHHYRVHNKLSSDKTDFKNQRIQAEMCTLNYKGIVQKLIERFDVCDGIVTIKTDLNHVPCH